MGESNGMLRHLAFFEELGRMDETDPNWRAVSAGLVVMRLVDQWIADGPSASRVDSWAVGAVREAIAQVSERTPVRRILTSIVDVMVTSTAIDMHALCPRLMAYGQSLEYEAKWLLAADVYQAIVATTHPVEDSDLAIAARLQLAFCLRTMGELDAATVMYRDASQLALSANDMISVLRGRLGDARIAIARGNLPEAEIIVDQTIQRAESQDLHEIRSRALGDRAHIAGLRGRYDQVIQYAYQSFEVAPMQRDRDRSLINIATAFRYLGLTDVARDAYLVIAATAAEQYVRWAADLNLMELAANEGRELQFDKYRRELESVDLTPLLRVTYLLHVGRGYDALGNSSAGVQYLERAIEMAGRHRFNQLLFEAEEAMVEAKRRKSRKPRATPAPIPQDLLRVIDAIQQMKETVGVA